MAAERLRGFNPLTYLQELYMKKFNEDHVDHISLDLHDFLIHKALENGFSQTEVVNFENLHYFLLEAFLPFFNSERNYN